MRQRLAQTSRAIDRATVSLLCQTLLIRFLVILQHIILIIQQHCYLLILFYIVFFTFLSFILTYKHAYHFLLCPLTDGCLVYSLMPICLITLPYHMHIKGNGCEKQADHSVTRFIEKKHLDQELLCLGVINLHNVGCTLQLGSSSGTPHTLPYTQLCNGLLTNLCYLINKRK